MQASISVDHEVFRKTTAFVGSFLSATLSPLTRVGFVEVARASVASASYNTIQSHYTIQNTFNKVTLSSASELETITNHFVPARCSPPSRPRSRTALRPRACWMHALAHPRAFAQHCQERAATRAIQISHGLC